MNGRYGTTALSRFEVGGPLAEALVGMAVLALAIIGLAGVFPWVLASAATIALGAAFIFESGALARRFTLLAQEAWGGIPAGFPAGCAGAALGILSILGIATAVLVPVAIIVYGVALAMDGRTRFVLRQMESENAGFSGMSLKVATESARMSAGIQALAGLAAIILGVLALIRIFPPVLSLAALLVIGATAAFYSSPAGRILNPR
ncbi:MAG: hypothetical protein ACP5SH_12740 [Syntrophobacteraceae bacterium]